MRVISRPNSPKMYPWDISRDISQFRSCAGKLEQDEGMRRPSTRVGEIRFTDL
jgi:hypothetical protein